jgi:triacylglycerol lipase
LAHFAEASRGAFSLLRRGRKTGAFSVSQERRVPPHARFVAIRDCGRGGSFFLPGIASLRYSPNEGNCSMSFLVELGRNAYPDDALGGFAASAQLDDARAVLDNARAMMWMSQLAYETAHRAKVESILGAWQLTMHAFISNDPVTGLPPKSACVVAAGGRSATIVSFSGTDPLKIEDWITDFSPALSATNLHSGFQDAVETVWPQINTVVTNRPASEQALFFTGHSLGGALAIIAAGRAMSELDVNATAVYTFGSPRTGGAAFFDRYTPNLGNSTFRLVHGTDIVPTVPPSLMGEFRHVGQLIQCPTDGRFDTQTPTLAPDENKPDFTESALQSGLADIRALAVFRFIRRIGPRPLDRFAGLLPRMVRDHVPANYFRALSITLR